MPIDQQSLAAGTQFGVKNVPQQLTAQVLPRKFLIIGTATKVVPYLTPKQIFSAEEAGDFYGFGSMIHRLAVAAFAGHNGLDTYVIAQEEAGGAVQAQGGFTWVGTATAAGRVSLYIGGVDCSFDVPKDATAAEVATLTAQAVTDTPEAGLSAVVNGGVPEQVDFTAKSAGPWGTDIVAGFNLLPGQELPAGLSIGGAPETPGSGIPDIQEALDALGTDDQQNEDYYTDMVHGYGLDTSTLDKISLYNGEGDTFTGNYKREVGRPFRSLNGDTAAGSGGLTALFAISDARLLDRTNGVLPVPGSPSNPPEIAAVALGIMARQNNSRAEASPIGQLLPGIFPGANDDNWTKNYDTRDQAVKRGVSITRVKNGAVEMDNVITFYRPATIPVDSNAYRSQRNLSIIQNILFNMFAAFDAESWKGFTVVADITQIGNTASKQKAKDVDSVRDVVQAQAVNFESNGWLYDAQYTIDQLKEVDSVVVRTSGNGFDYFPKYILSGEGGILNGIAEIDTSLSVFQ